MPGNQIIQSPPPRIIQNFFSLQKIRQFRSPDKNFRPHKISFLITPKISRGILAGALATKPNQGIIIISVISNNGLQGWIGRGYVPSIGKEELVKEGGIFITQKTMTIRYERLNRHGRLFIKL